jgi:hypothetical protein
VYLVVNEFREGGRLRPRTDLGNGDFFTEANGDNEEPIATRRHEKPQKTNLLFNWNRDCFTTKITESTKI